MFIALTAAEKTVAPKKSSNVTAEVTKTKDLRGKRNLNGFGNYQTAGRRIGNGDGYDYSQQQFQGASGGYSKYFLVLNHLKVSNKYFLIHRLRAKLCKQWIRCWSKLSTIC